MNIATAFLAENWEQLGLSRITSPERLSWLALTPGFPASSHILFFVLCEGTTEPVLVMKVSRVPGEDPSLSREAANLQIVHTTTRDAAGSIPRLLAFNSDHGNAMLIETALVGTQMDPAFVRSRPKFCAEAGMKWITTLHEQTAVNNYERPGWFGRLVDSPIERIDSAVELSKDEKSLLKRARQIAESLRYASFPLVFSHGDLSDPNILVLRKGGIGVVDWEMAEPESFPAADLFFFLNYVVTARSPWANGNDVSAFQKAFFSEKSWTRGYIAQYVEKLGLSRDLLVPLFVLCFTRYLSGLIARLQATGEVLDIETSAWLRTDRAYVLWREAVQHSHRLCLA